MQLKDYYNIDYFKNNTLQCPSCNWRFVIEEDCDIIVMTCPYCEAEVDADTDKENFEL